LTLASTGAASVAGRFPRLFQQTGVAGQRLQGDDFASGLRASGDAVGDRTHSQRVHAVITTRAVGQKYGFGGWTAGGVEWVAWTAEP
jgi:hypothetical protein